jgi:ATP-binding cassette subfamily B protein
MHGLRTLYRLMSGARRRHLLVTFLLMLAGVAAEMVTIGAVLPFLALASDPGSPLVGPRLRDFLSAAGPSPLVGAAVLLAAAALAAATVRLLLFWTSQSFVMKLGHEIASAIFSRMLRQPYAAYLRGNSSETLSGIEKVQGVVFSLIQPAMQGVIAAVMAFFVTLLLFAISPMAASLGVASVGLAYVAMSRFTRGRVRRNARVMGEAMTLRTRAIQEGLGGIRDILLERSHDMFEQRFRKIDLQLRRAQAVNAFVAASPRFVVEGAGIVAIAMITLIMSLQPGGVVKAIPVLGALALGAQRLLPLVQQAWFGWSQAAGNAQLLADVAALLETPVPPPPRPEPPLAFEEAVVLDRVSFRYEGGVFALRDASLEIRRGERLGIAGETGGGKSTLLDLLMGLLEADEGEIRVDGAALDVSRRAAWQATLAHVPQSIFLADDTIAANIAFAAPGAVDRPRIAAAARAACLGEFVAGLPEGFDTRVGERGIRLSGGQRQRIGIARALYKGAPLLILDEATSALDEATEAAVMASLASVPGLTLVIVSHRRFTLERCDRVVRVEAGRLISD